MVARPSRRHTRSTAARDIRQHDGRRSPTHDCRFAQGDLSRCVAEMILDDLLDRLQAPEGSRRRTLFHISNECVVIIRIAAVFAAQGTLDEVDHIRVEPVVFVHVRRSLLPWPSKRICYVVASTSAKRTSHSISPRNVAKMNFSYAFKRAFFAPTDSISDETHRLLVPSSCTTSGSSLTCHCDWHVSEVI